ncbi:hypothetical protein OROHE_026416 [Orobanche hederae]
MKMVVVRTAKQWRLQSTTVAADGEGSTDFYDANFGEVLTEGIIVCWMETTIEDNI